MSRRHEEMLVGLLEGMMSPAWQRPSDSKIKRMLAQVRGEDAGESSSSQGGARDPAVARHGFRREFRRGMAILTTVEQGVPLDVLVAVDLACAVLRGERGRLPAEHREAIEGWTREGGDAWADVGRGARRGLLQAMDVLCDERDLVGVSLHEVTRSQLAAWCVAQLTRYSPPGPCDVIMRASAIQCGLRAIDSRIPIDAEALLVLEALAKKVLVVRGLLCDVEGVAIADDEGGW